MSTRAEPPGDPLGSSEGSARSTTVDRVWYVDPVVDTAALVSASQGGAVYSLGYLPTLVVSGKDRVSWLNGLLTCDVSKVQAGVAAWGLLLDRVGKVQAMLGIVEHQHRTVGASLLVGVLWGDAKDVQHQLDMRLVMEDAELERFDDWHWAVGVGNLQQDSDHAAAVGKLDLAGPCSLIAEPSFVELGTRAALSDAAWALWRLRSGLPWGGVDFDTSVRPHEAALDRKAVSWSKGCYLGQEVVCMQDMRGKVKKRLAVFTTIGDAFTDQVPRANVRRGGVEVGKVTSAVYEPRKRRWTLFASVPTVALPDPAPVVATFGGHEAALQGRETELTWEIAAGLELPLQWVA